MTSGLGEVADWLSYDIPPTIAGQAWKGKYRGQRQKWFAFRFLGAESEIDISVERSADGGPPEFGAWRWEELARTPELVVPFRRAVYQWVAEEFARFAK